MTENLNKNWPMVTVCVCTYDRPEEILRTINSHGLRLYYPFERTAWHIADDGTPGGYAEDIVGYLTNKGIPYGDVTKTVTNRQGFGVNVNTALKAIKTDYIYFTEDDYVLQKAIDLNAYIALMETVPEIGMVRFGIAGHGFAARMREADISKWLPEYNENDSNRGYTGKGKLNYWEIPPNQPPGPFTLYRYSNRPHLVHRRFYEAYGLYPEGLSLGATEEAMNHQIAQVPNGPQIVCPMNFSLWHFDHIGESRQGTKEDVHVR